MKEYQYITTGVGGIGSGYLVRYEITSYTIYIDFDMSTRYRQCSTQIVELRIVRLMEF